MYRTKNITQGRLTFIKQVCEVLNHASQLQCPSDGADLCIMLCYSTSVKSKLAAADTDRAAAHSQQSSQLSQVQPLIIMSIHHRPFTTVLYCTSYVSHIELCLSKQNY